MQQEAVTLLESADGDDGDSALLEDEEEAQTSGEAEAEQAARALLGLPGTNVVMLFWQAPCLCSLCQIVPGISGFVNTFAACPLFLLQCTACDV